MTRRIIDLSTPVTTGHFRWPVERKLLKSHATGEGQGTWAGWNLHAFTHMDSPRHVDPEGFTTDAITPEMTVGEAAILDLMDIPANQPISAERMAERVVAGIEKDRFEIFADPSTALLSKVGGLIGPALRPYLDRVARKATGSTR